MSNRVPLAVLVSGGGTNLQSIIEATRDPKYSADVAVVISDRPGVKALDRAREAGLPTVVVDWSDYDDRGAFTNEVCDAAEDHGAEGLVLAGFMRILAPAAIDRFPGRIVNIHPALLPAFPGAHAVDDALAYGVTITGVTIHFVDEQVDHGPIIYQEALAVMPGEEREALQARIQAVEHRMFPVAIDALARGRLHIEGRMVRWEQA